MLAGINVERVFHVGDVRTFIPEDYIFWGKKELQVRS